MKIVNLKKFVRSIIILLVLIFGVSIIFAKATLSYKQVEYVSVYVDYGDTLWGIAQKQKETNDYYKKRDVRDIIADIKKVNNLNSGDLYIAQELKIPTL